MMSEGDGKTFFEASRSPLSLLSSHFLCILCGTRTIPWQNYATGEKQAVHIRCIKVMWASVFLEKPNRFLRKTSEILSGPSDISPSHSPGFLFICYPRFNSMVIIIPSLASNAIPTCVTVDTELCKLLAAKSFFISLIRLFFLLLLVDLWTDSLSLVVFVFVFFKDFTTSFTVKRTWIRRHNSDRISVEIVLWT